jgi:hypothetical protein
MRAFGGAPIVRPQQVIVNLGVLSAAGRRVVWT